MSTSVSSSTVAGVVVALNPTHESIRRWSVLARQVAGLVVIDNGSEAGVARLILDELDALGGTVIRNAENLGVAAALNQGLTWAEKAGCVWAVTMDQDSRPEPDMVAQLLDSVERAPEPDQVSLVGARIVEERFPDHREPVLMPGFLGIGFRWLRGGEHDLSGVTLLITSGTLTRVAHWREVGGFDEGLFIDYVDFDLCLKLQLAGHRLVASAKAGLTHNLGSKRRVMIGSRKFHPTFHSPTRHYYMARNRVVMWRRYALRFPHWWVFDAYGNLRNLVRVALIEDQRWPKICAFWRGVWDGCRGRMGPMQ